MTDEQFDKLKSNVLAEVRKKHSKHPHPNHMKVLGKFITAYLNRERMSSRDFAYRVGVPSIVVDLLLRGDLPEWVLSEAFVDRLAQSADYEANIVRIMMRREIAPISGETSGGERRSPRRRARYSGQE